MKQRKQTTYLSVLALCVLFSFLLCGCSGTADGSGTAGSSHSPKSSASPKDQTPRDNTPLVLTPEASGVTVYSRDVTSVDASNTSQGYLILNYSGTNEKVKLQIKTPDDTPFTYLVTARETDIVYPLTGGSGSYSVSLLESVSTEDDMYAVSFTQTLEVTLEDEFLPYLYPNVYAAFTTDSNVVKKGTSLAADCYSDLDVVGNIYNYVIKNISYDTKKAENLAYGYTPDVDATLASGKGICFDYASVMTSMLRSQKIPTKLEVGYAGEVYHAWISCYVDEIGWVDNIIEFDGKSWSLIDPTLAANNSGSSVKKYIGDGSNYVVKYTY